MQTFTKSGLFEYENIKIRNINRGNNFYNGKYLAYF